MVPSVAVIILNWNGWRDTIECLESIHRVTYENRSVVVVDNASEDDSVDEIKRFCEGRSAVESKFFQYAPGERVVKVVELTREQSEIPSAKSDEPESLRKGGTLFIIKNEKNFGFAEGNNIGIRFALRTLQPDYVLLLNNDTVVDPRFLDALISVAENDKTIGILGPKIYYYDYQGRSDVIWSAGGQIELAMEMIYRSCGATQRDTGQFEKVEQRPWTSGAAMLVRSELARDLPLNNSYPFGHEDVEYGLMSARRGYRTVFVPSSKVWHKVGASKKKTGYAIGRDVSGYLRFLKNNFPRSVYLYHLGIFFIAALPRWALMYALRPEEKRTLRPFLSDMARFIRKR